MVVKVGGKVQLRTCRSSEHGMSTKWSPLETDVSKKAMNCKISSKHFCW